MFRRLFRKNTTLDRAQFARALFEKLRDIESISTLHHSDPVGDGFEIVYSGQQDPVKVNLDNAFRHYRDPNNRPEERDAILHEWAVSFSQPPGSGAVTRAGLFPLLRHFAYLGEHGEQVIQFFEEDRPLPEGYGGPLVIPFGGDLVFMLAHEAAHDVTGVHQADLDEIGMTVEEAWEAAFGNISNPRFELQIADVTDTGLSALFFQDEAWLTPIILSFHDVFQDMMESNDLSALLVSVPSRAGVLFIDADRPHAEGIIAHQVAEALTMDHPQSGIIFRMIRGAPGLEVVRVVHDSDENV